MFASATSVGNNLLYSSSVCIKGEFEGGTLFICQLR